MAQMKTLNGYEVVDVQARADIEVLQNKEVDLSSYYTKTETDTAIQTAVDAIDIPEVDFTGYATEQYVQDQIDAIPEVDLSEYAKQTWVQEQNYLTEHQSLEGYATETYVDEAIAGVVHPEPDLSGYYTKEEVDAKLPVLPTVVSAFENDAGYLTEHQSLEAYALKTEIPTDDHINSLINTALGVIENGTY